MGRREETRPARVIGAVLRTASRRVRAERASVNLELPQRVLRELGVPEMHVVWVKVQVLDGRKIGSVQLIRVYDPPFPWGNGQKDVVHAYEAPVDGFNPREAADALRVAGVMSC